MASAASTRPRPAPSVPVLALRDVVYFPGAVHTLHVTREVSRRAIRAAQESGEPIFCAAQRDSSVADPRVADLHPFGVMCDLLQTSPLPDGSMRAVLRARSRARLVAAQRRKSALAATVEGVEEVRTEPNRLEALARACQAEFARVAEWSKQIPPEAAAAVGYHEDPGQVADAIAHHLPLRSAAKQSLLEELDVAARLERVFEAVVQELRILEIQRDVAQRVDRSFGSAQRELYLREQLRAIHGELGESDSAAAADEWRRKVEQAQLPEAARAAVLADIERLDRIPGNTPEGAILRTHLEWMLALPWSVSTEDCLDLARARAILDERHFGLEPVKTRIVEYLAVRKLTRSLRGPILCFVGPPGVGKTSAAMAIADALGRKFGRISLGGLRDEAEIKGHRRTYVGAMPGQILKELRQCGSRNPVLLLDEIDKLNRDYRGDPSGALLEALDPTLNSSYIDHYLEHPFDLSETLFVATANSTVDILPALLDRMEVVEFSSYTEAERLAICRDFLLPRLIENHGLGADGLALEPSAWEALLGRYAQEPGVRQLEHRLSALCRKAALRLAHGTTGGMRVAGPDLEGLLGPPDDVGWRAEVGIEGRCLGLAVSMMGGHVMPIDAATFSPAGSRPEILVTGNLGEVMRESAQAAVSYLRAHLARFGLEPPFRRDVHIHLGEGGWPKDGPSAGLAVAIALCSAVGRIRVRPGLAATGEIGLHGDVRPVGGLREKLIAAKRAGLDTVLLPARNEPDARRLPAELRDGLRLEFVDSIDQALTLALMPSVPGAAAIDPQWEPPAEPEKRSKRNPN